MVPRDEGVMGNTMYKSRRWGSRKRSLRGFVVTVEKLYLTVKAQASCWVLAALVYKHPQECLHELPPVLWVVAPLFLVQAQHLPSHTSEYLQKGGTYCFIIEPESMLHGSTSAAVFIHWHLWNTVRSVWWRCKGLGLLSVALHQQWKPLLLQQPPTATKSNLSMKFSIITG